MTDQDHENRLQVGFRVEKAWTAVTDIERMDKRPSFRM
jgi:hypothetical protein